MELWASPYKLRSRSPLSAKASSLERSGALLRVRDGTNFGYADLHPWPELGDQPLDIQLAELATGRTTSLSSRSLAFASLDAGFRSREVAAFARLIVPGSHFLVTDLGALTETTLSKIWADGFRILKLKLGRDLAADVRILSSLPLLRFQLRFDFNGTLDVAAYVNFVTLLPREVRDRIEFVEDPVPWSVKAWRECAAAGPALALDRAPSLEISETPFDWCILKPAVQEPERVRALALAAGAQLCVTSYMDHPLGQVMAAYVAAQIPEVKTCGLLTHLCLVESEWTERLTVEETRLVPPAGPGFGFTDLLEKENWKRIR